MNAGAPDTPSAATSILAGEARRAIPERLVAWFAEAQRPLPWRRDYDPYAVWVAEMMLQQTQVETVRPYYDRWMERFPTVQALAAAPLDDVLKAWAGMGYYARARHLHRAAREVAERHGGRLPDTCEALVRLPGIGRYTGSAIASIAFNRPVPVVDGNVARVLSRLAALEAPARSREGEAALWRLAGALLPAGRAREFNQALMELGALVCRPRQPLCGQCPVRGHCRAHAAGRPERYPLRTERRPRKAVRAALAVLERDGRWLVRRRPPRGLWGGLWEFPWAERQGEEAPEAALHRLAESLGLAPEAPRALGEVRHGLTHREFVWECLHAPVNGGGALPADDDGEGGAWRWVTPEDTRELALSRFMHKALRLAPAPGGGRDDVGPAPRAKRS